MHMIPEINWVGIKLEPIDSKIDSTLDGLCDDFVVFVNIRFSHIMNSINVRISIIEHSSY